MFLVILGYYEVLNTVPESSVIWALSKSKNVIIPAAIEKAIAIHGRIILCLFICALFDIRI